MFSSKHITFDTSKTGLERSLGPLTAAVMNIVWNNGNQPITVKEVWKRAEKDYQRKDLSYTTIASTMTRMYANGLLKRQSSDAGAWLYSPAETWNAYHKRVVFSIMDSFAGDETDLIYLRQWLRDHEVEV